MSHNVASPSDTLREILARRRADVASISADEEAQVTAALSAGVITFRDLDGYTEEEEAQFLAEAAQRVQQTVEAIRQRHLAAPGPNAEPLPPEEPQAQSRIGVRRIGQFADAALRRLEARANESERPIPLPWKKPNELLGGGLWPGLHVLVGNTGSYKTQFALQAALAAAEQGVPALYIGLELGEVDVVARLAGLLSGQRWSDLFLGKSRTAFNLALQSAAVLEQLPFYAEMGAPRGWNYRWLYESAAEIRAKHPVTQGTPEQPSVPMLVVLDFLQLVTGNEREDIRTIIGSAAYAGRAIAREHDAAVLMISSTARDNYKTLEGKEEAFGQGSPTRLVGMGKESGEIEYAADSVSVLCREPWEKDGDGRAVPPPNGSTVWLAVAKGRAVLPGWAELRFDGGRFTEPEAPPYRGFGKTRVSV